ncbi:MAG TPA: hypothetical protein VMV46_19820 [Thermoanaerobaculia bacterium]|nr:hypothetical protein [Thermoanaerobaculia bacterium]
MRRSLGGLSIVGVLLSGTLLASPLRADRVILTNGNALEGRAEVLGDGSVAVTSAMGTWTVAAHRVARVERSETAEDRVRSRLRAAAEPTPDLLYDLALEAREAGAETLALQLARRAIELEPDHEPARRLLGYRRDGARWLSEAEWRARSGHAAEERRDLIARGALDLSRRELDARFQVESARLALLARAVEAREATRETSTGIPLAWVWSASAPFVPSPFVAVPATGGIPPATPRLGAPVAPSPRAAPRASRPASRPSPPVANRSRLVSQPPASPGGG